MHDHQHQSSPGFSAGRVLVVDGDLFIRLFLRTALERTGHEVREAVDSREAMRHYIEWRPSCVIADLMMREREGLETVLRMRRHIHQAFIIATFAQVGSRTALYANMAKGLGADAVLEKPFTVEELLSLVTAPGARRGEATGLTAANFADAFNRRPAS